MTRTSLKRAAVAGLVGIALVVALSPAPAIAQREILRDATSDVWSPSNDGAGYDEAGSVVNTDIKRTTLRHHARVFHIELRYVELKKRASEEITFYGYLRTSRQRVFEVVAEVDWLGRDADFFMRNFEDGTLINCEKIGGSTGFHAELLRVSVPRVCLGKPQWVRYQGTAESYSEDTGRFLDSALGSGPTLKRWSHRVYWARG